MIDRFFIYGLYDPRDGRIRYVGKSSIGMSRPKDEHAAYCRNWEKQLESLGLKKEIRILEKMPNETNDKKTWLNEREIFWIKKFKEQGENLTNLSSGGDGGATGVKRSLETREKMRRAKLGNKHALGRRHSLEAREKIRLFHLGKKVSDETKKKISETLKSYNRKRKEMSVAFFCHEKRS